MIYDIPVKDFEPYIKSKGYPYCYVYYLDGKVESFTYNKKGV